MYGVTDLRKDTLIDIDGVPYKVLEYAQKQMGRGGSIVNTKLKNLITGQVIDKTFKNVEKVKPAEIGRQSVQYLYNTGGRISVMDQTSYETIELDLSVDENIPKYIIMYVCDIIITYIYLCNNLLSIWCINNINMMSFLLKY